MKTKTTNKIVETQKLSFDLWIAAAKIDTSAKRIGVLDKHGNVTADGWRAWFLYLAR